MEKRVIPLTLGNDKLRTIISEIIEPNNVFGNLEFQLTNKNDLNNVGLIGFNVLDFGKYTKFSYIKYLLGYKPLGMIGMLHLSISERLQSQYTNTVGLDTSIITTSLSFTNS